MSGVSVIVLSALSLVAIVELSRFPCPSFTECVDTTTSSSKSILWVLLLLFVAHLPFVRERSVMLHHIMCFVGIGYALSCQRFHAHLLVQIVSELTQGPMTLYKRDRSSELSARVYWMSMILFRVIPYAFVSYMCIVSSYTSAFEGALAALLATTALSLNSYWFCLLTLRVFHKTPQKK